MITAKTGIRSEEVRFGSQHVLFVEGKDHNAIDPTVLNGLFSDELRIEPLGPSFSVKSVAQALHQHHPTYYFLIDRDHYGKDVVERCWCQFPDPGANNLLIWRRRELENYFLEPDYLIQSEYCEVDKKALGDKILNVARTRLFLDAANHVVISVREGLKQNWIDIFTNPDEFITENDALNMLLKSDNFPRHCSNVQRTVSPTELERRFRKVVNEMTGGTKQINFDVGNWLEQIKGKMVLTQVINSECFRVRALNGNLLQGKEKLQAVVRDLLNKDTNVQPKDFKDLKKLIDTQIRVG